MVVSVTVLVGNCRQEQALDAPLITVRFKPVGASVQDAMYTDAGVIPSVTWRLRTSAGAGSWVIVLVMVSLGTVTTWFEVNIVVVKETIVLYHSKPKGASSTGEAIKRCSGACRYSGCLLNSKIATAERRSIFFIGFE